MGNCVCQPPCVSGMPGGCGVISGYVCEGVLEERSIRCRRRVKITLTHVGETQPVWKGLKRMKMWAKAAGTHPCLSSDTGWHASWPLTGIHAIPSPLPSTNYMTSFPSSPHPRWLEGCTINCTRSYNRLTKYICMYASICLLSIYHLPIIYLSSTYHPSIYPSTYYLLSVIYLSTNLLSIYLSSIYHSSIYHLPTHHLCIDISYIVYMCNKYMCVCIKINQSLVLFLCQTLM